MRLIDADSFKQILNKETIGGIIVARIIDTRPTIDTKAQWIPVSERLPEKYEDVLITYRIENEKAARIWIGYRTETAWWTYGVRCQNVTAWMPLPEAYEPDDAGQEV